MKYVSTRGCSPSVNSAQAVVLGLAADGGLYMPEKFPDLSVEKCLKGDTLSIAESILSAMLPDIPDMGELVRKAYTGKFQTEDLTPVVPVGEFSVLELFRGPTCAFKDVALSMLPRLLTAARRTCGMEKDILILTATSGDTGKAALEGFRDVPGVRICVFYPDGGVSPVQRAQMVTQEGSNVTVCGVKGNFDDAQTGVKNIFAACQKANLLESKNFRLSSANSINIGRLVPQVTYYFKAYQDLLNRNEISMGDQVNFSVPTGNFGDILAGYFAKIMGLPVGKLICASNANHVLTDFVRTGTYDRRRPLYRTLSPSMDILVSSNLERLLYLFSGEDPELVRNLMDQLTVRGHYTVPEAILKSIQNEFRAGYCDDRTAQKTIEKVYRKYGYLCDPHTASGWHAAEEYNKQTGDTRPMVVLSTASPFKFPGAVLPALGAEPSGDAFDQMKLLEKRSGIPVPPALSGLHGRQQRFTGVIRKEDMLEFVMNL